MTTGPGEVRSTLSAPSTSSSVSSGVPAAAERPASGGTNDVLDQLLRNRPRGAPEGVDQDRARDAERRGVILRYSAILSVIRKEAPGDIVGVSLREISQDRWRYEFKILGFDGRYTEASLDARSGAVLRKVQR